MISAKIHGVVLDPITNGFAVILKAEANNKWLPIFVGPFEAQAIALELEHTKPPRPLTHDLMRNILQTLNVTIVKINVVSLKEATFHATIFLQHNSNPVEIDARPSDAIALALRMNAPIFVEEEVLEKAGLDYQPQENEHSRNIKNLQIKLSQAIEREAFEEAAKIRDEIKTTLQQKPSEKQSQ